MADNNDLYDISQMYNKCFSEPLNISAFENYIKEESAYKLVKNNNENIAYAMVDGDDDDNFVNLDWFFVNPKYQGQKDGSHFLRQLLTILSPKYPSKVIRVLRSSEKGLNLYKKIMTVDSKDSSTFYYYPTKNS